MDVRNCRQCGKLYNYIGGSYRNLCPSCIKQLEDKFMEIKEYIRDNKVASISEISDKFEVSTKQIEQWVREERLPHPSGALAGPHPAERQLHWCRTHLLDREEYREPSLLRHAERTYQLPERTWTD